MSSDWRFWGFFAHKRCSFRLILPGNACEEKFKEHTVVYRFLTLTLASVLAVLTLLIPISAKAQTVQVTKADIMAMCTGCFAVSEPMPNSGEFFLFTNKDSVATLSLPPELEHVDGLIARPGENTTWFVGNTGPIENWSRLFLRVNPPPEEDTPFISPDMIRSWLKEKEHPKTTVWQPGPRNLIYASNFETKLTVEVPEVLGATVTTYVIRAGSMKAYLGPQPDPLTDGLWIIVTARRQI